MIETFEKKTFDIAHLTPWLRKFAAVVE